MAQDTLLGFPAHPFLTIAENLPLNRQSPGASLKARASLFPV